MSGVDFKIHYFDIELMQQDHTNLHSYKWCDHFPIEGT